MGRAGRRWRPGRGTCALLGRPLETPTAASARLVTSRPTGTLGTAATLRGARVSVSRAALGPLPAHLRQVLVVEQMRLTGLEAVLTLALVEDVGLEFPARVLLGR